MRVVFDTVVLVRGLLDPSSWSGKLLFDESHAYEWAVSPEIVAEYLRVLKRPGLTRKYPAVENRDLQAMLAQIATATIVQPLIVPTVCRDPSDDKFLAAATVGEARYIVSEDADLLDLVSYEEIAIVSTSRFMQIIEHE